MTWDPDKNAREILRGNIQNREPTWSPQQVERAVEVAKVSWGANMGNGQASQIGIDVIKMQDRNRTN